MFNNIISNYFGFNRQQRNGLLVLLCISFFLLLVRIIYPYFIQPDPIIIQNLPLIERRLDSSAAFRTQGFQADAKHALFVFDPNIVTFEQLLALGFREKTAKTFIKFRSKGFVFKNKEDLKKIYGISDRFYAQLEPYVLIPSAAPAQKEQASQPGKQEIASKPQAQKKVELNSCDSLELVALNGIGPSYAKRILKYRSILGGYVSTEQLKEVYGFPEELFEKLRPVVTVNTALVKQINLNTDDFKTVNKHPYLSYELTKTIFNWRRKTTITATNLKDILNDDALYNKLLPYLAF